MTAGLIHTQLIFGPPGQERRYQDQTCVFDRDNLSMIEVPMEYENGERIVIRIVFDPPVTFAGGAPPEGEDG